MATLSWHNSRYWSMRAEEIRALSDDMRDTEAKAIMLRIANDYNRLAKYAHEHEQGATEGRIGRG